jgi:hypothetical protein
VFFEPLVGVLVLEVDGQQEGAAGERNGVGQFANHMVKLDP